MFPIFMIISALAVKNDPAKEQQNAKNDEYASKYFASFIIEMVSNILTKIKSYDRFNFTRIYSITCHNGLNVSWYN